MIKPVILVVDDEVEARNTIIDFLEMRYECKFREAKDGDEAVKFIKSSPCDVILLDIRMKGMDGLAALKHIKELDKSIKIIMVTALADQDKMHEAYKLGACDYITKPLILDYLEQTVLKNLKG